MLEPLFISWTQQHGRSQLLAAQLQAKPVFVAVGQSGNRLTAPFRYLAQTIVTLLLLARERPSAVICMAPPDTLVLLLLGWRMLARGTRVVIDAHSGAVISRGTSHTRKRFAWLARRADGVIVTNSALAERLSGAAIFIADNPPCQSPIPASPASGPPLIVFPASWEFDEPIEQVIEAAGLLPDCRFVITGKPVPGRLRQQTASNVELSGFLPSKVFDRLLSQAHVVLSLTTRAETMQQSAYEALDRQIAIVATDSKVLKDLLHDAAVYTRNEPQGVADAIRQALQEAPALRCSLAEVQSRRVSENEACMTSLRRLLTTSQ